MRTKPSYCKACVAACAALLSFLSTAFAQQTPDTLSMEDVLGRLSRIEKLRQQYNFPSAMDICAEIEDAVIPREAEPLLSESMMLSSNGENMMDFCSTPRVISKQRFSLRDFFLHYPLKDRSWRTTPNMLDSLGGKFSSAVYFPEGEETVFFSSVDGGVRNLFTTSWQDSVWTAPELVSEGMTSSEDEIFPILSPDGQNLYFASKGLFGMGGYDLYVSSKDKSTGEWGAPVNLGFPYSSPYDDFLYAVSDDMKYAYFASNRECGPESDSVFVYVVEYETSPVRKKISSFSELAQLSRLDVPTSQGSSTSEADRRIDPYLDAYTSITELKKEISSSSERMNEVRSSLSKADSQKKASLMAELQKMELDIPLLQDSLSKQTARLQDMEMDLLSQGIVVDPIKELRKRNSTTVAFSFPSMRMGPALDIEILEPEPVFDYSFQVLEEGRFALDNTLPSGLVYQIQLFTQQGKASPDKLGGLSPVFTREEAGRVIHAAGLFRTYKDVLANVPKARKSFRNAFIVAFMDGKPVTVAKAREIEKTIHETFIVRILPNDGANLSSAARSAITAITDKDVVRETEGGTVSFTLGTFDSREEANTVAKLLKSSGLTNVTVESSGFSQP